jgi:hypothetical protein
MAAGIFALVSVPGHHSLLNVTLVELSVVMVDTRVGKVGWRTIARGEAADPWTALTRAVKALTPGIP